jgi:hypothetical protein
LCKVGSFRHGQPRRRFCCRSSARHSTLDDGDLTRDYQRIWALLTSGEIEMWTVDALEPMHQPLEPASLPRLPEPMQTPMAGL